MPDTMEAKNSVRRSASAARDPERASISTSTRVAPTKRAMAADDHRDGHGEVEQETQVGDDPIRGRGARIEFIFHGLCSVGEHSTEGALRQREPDRGRALTPPVPVGTL